MFELPPMFLALAFILVGLAAYFLGRRNGAARTVRLPRDYYVGLDHLINDRFDHAAEIFARMAQADGDAAEIQFALGSLFRRRGEVDRAIAIHSRLRDHGGAGSRDKAAFALALDYQSAGLMDRAERVLEELGASGEYRRVALDHLVGIYEAQGDWAKALKVFHELPPAVQTERAQVAAHYLCELAEQALLQGEAERAGALLKQARTHQEMLPRADILTARIAERAGDLAGALLLYLQACGGARSGAGDHPGRARCGAPRRQPGCAERTRAAVAAKRPCQPAPARLATGDRGAAAGSGAAARGRRGTGLGGGVRPPKPVP